MDPKDWNKMKKLLEDVADQETLEAVKALVEGLETNLSGSLTANVIKSVQRGRVSMSTAAVNVAINAVDLDKSFVNILSYEYNNSNAAANYNATGRLVDATTLRVLFSVAEKNYYINWEVIEFY